MSEPIGFGGYPAAGILGEKPEAVNYDRSRGYPWKPWDAIPERYLIGASGVGKPVDKNWGPYNRNTIDAVVAARFRKELATYSRAPEAVSFIKEEMWKESNKARNAGSALHLYISETEAGRTPSTPLAEESQGHYAGWLAFKERYGLRLGAIERTVYAPDFGTAGTADVLAVAANHPRYPANALIGLDFKRKNQWTGGVTPDLGHLLQATALSQSRYIGIEEHRVLLELPPIAGFGIVYLCRDGVRCYWIDPHQPQVLALARACIDALDGKRAINNGAFGFVDVLRTQEPPESSIPEPSLVEAPDAKEQVA